MQFTILKTSGTEIQRTGWQYGKELHIQSCNYMYVHSYVEFDLFLSCFVPSQERHLIELEEMVAEKKRRNERIRNQLRSNSSN